MSTLTYTDIVSDLRQFPYRVLAARGITHLDETEKQKFVDSVYQTLTERIEMTLGTSAVAVATLAALARRHPDADPQDLLIQSIDSDPDVLLRLQSDCTSLYTELTH